MYYIITHAYIVHTHVATCTCSYIHVLHTEPTRYVLQNQTCLHTCNYTCSYMYYIIKHAYIHVHTHVATCTCSCIHVLHSELHVCTT